MRAATFVGRTGSLAMLLGTGLAISICSAGAAAADSRDTLPSAPSASSAGPAASARAAGTARRAVRPPAMAAVAVLPARPAVPSAPVVPAPAPGVPAPAPGDAVAAAFARSRSVQKPPSAAAVAAARSGRSAILNNQTPVLHPAQIRQGPGGVVTGSLNATDPDSSTLTYTVTGNPVHGTVAVDSGGGYTYTADAAVAATGTTDSFQVSVSDAASGFHVHGGLLNLLTGRGGAGHTSSATVPVTVAPFGGGGVNHPPTGTVSVGSPDPVTGVVTGAVLGSDPDLDPLTYSGSTTTSKGAVAVAAGGSFSYTPTDAARQAAGSPTATAADLQDGFTVTINDGRGGTAALAVTVPVSPTSEQPPPPTTPLVAFPGAEGFGAYATGGRGGSVVYVTNLNANGPGSLQWAIDQPGTKYVLFKVSGLIDTQIHLTNGNVTIAGQTSPGGITVRGFVTDETPYQDQTVQPPADFAENWILQDIRVRPGLDGPSDDGLRLRYTRNAIVDHVSIGNATDEAIEISYSHDITVQNTIIAETVGGHSFYGGILMNYSNPANGFGLNDVSLHHNIFNRIEGRLPEGSRESQAAANSTMNLELSDNLYWDPNFFIALAPSTGVATGPGGNPYPIYWKINAVNNVFHTRPDFPYGMFDDQIMRDPHNQLYVSGNKMNIYPNLSDYQLFYCCNDFTASGSNTGAQVAQKLPSRLPFPAITYTPTDLLQNTLLNTAGAWPRDPMDRRLLQSIASNTIATAPRNTNPAGDALLPAFTGAPPAAPVDTDNDGMPDSWETARGLNPNVANTNGHTLSSVGYTDLEVYLQDLSASRVTGWAG